MKRNIGYSVGVAALTLGLLTMTAPGAAAAARALTISEVRTQFTQCGYEVGNPGSPGNTPYIVLRDPGASLVRNADYRIAMAIVYKDEAAAAAAHTRAHRQAEETVGERWPFSDDNGPQLLAGYGGSVWRANVAIVQSSARTLSSMYSSNSETDETQVARPELFELGFVSSYTQLGVDRDFVVCMEDAAPLTAARPDAIVTPTVSIEPNFIPGHPW
jgi:hypothetical protein